MSIIISFITMLCLITNVVTLPPNKPGVLTSTKLAGPRLFRPLNTVLGIPVGPLNRLIDNVKQMLENNLARLNSTLQLLILFVADNLGLFVLVPELIPLVYQLLNALLTDSGIVRFMLEIIDDIADKIANQPTYIPGN